MGLFCVLCGAKGPKHNVHRFPTKSHYRSIWLAACSLDSIPRNSGVCRDHFTEDDFHWRPQRALLKQDAVPKKTLPATFEDDISFGEDDISFGDYDISFGDIVEVRIEEVDQVLVYPELTSQGGQPTPCYSYQFHQEAVVAPAQPNPSMPLSYAEQQHARDLREHLNSRRRQGKVRQLSLRSRSRSSEDKDSDTQGRRSPAPVGRGRRVRRDSCSSRPSGSVSSSSASAGRSSHTPFERETDPVILARRQKQLDYGRNTLCYQEYTKAVPKHKRESFHPRTPIKSRRTSRRRWDCAIKNWRIHLHYWNDPVKLAELRRKNSDSDWSESESTGVASVASTPEPRRTREHRADPRLVVKQEPLEPDVSTVKQEPIELAAPTARRQIQLETASVTVKQEPMTPDLTAIKQERQDSPEPAVVKQEFLEPAVVKQEYPGQEAEQILNQLTAAPKQEPAELDYKYDPSFSWADDVEDLAEELAG